MLVTVSLFIFLYVTVDVAVFILDPLFISLVNV
nr:MAG TPA: hypothetical protein [Caudoviricetes sp.]